MLSLLFIDKVKNYRSYGDGASSKGKFAVWFEEIFREYAAKPEYSEVIPFDAERVHNGYFAQDKKGVLKDSREGRTSEGDTEAYELIMKDKENLLEMNEPLRFIFSHSALREGWDNPNVFQLCTLNETTSELKKRQEIGRGLRLAVNSDGNRVFDKAVNRLTVIANESYEEFAKKLQKEIEDETGEKFEGRIKKAREKGKVTLRKGYDADPKFIELWERIRQKTTYRVEYQTDELIRKGAKRVGKMREILAPRIVAQRTKLVMDSISVSGEAKSIEFHSPEYSTPAIPDIVGYIEQRTHLTRSTIIEILRQSGRLLDCLKNPQLFLESAGHEIRTELEATMIDGVKYQKIENEYYEMRQFASDEIEEYLTNLYGVKNKEKTIFDNIEIDSLSETERKFAEACDDSNDVEFFLKLPRWFEIETPVGKYRPDWALMLKKEKRLYFVAETKSTLDRTKRLESENQKIECGRKHFKELKEVHFTDATKLEDVEKAASQIK